MVTIGVLALYCIVTFGTGFLGGYVFNELTRKDVKKMASEERCVCCGQVIPEGRQVCVICGYKAEKKKTNYDRIKNMSIDEMAEFIDKSLDECKKRCKFGIDGKCDGFGFSSKCVTGIKKYLESEVDTE